MDKKVAWDYALGLIKIDGLEPTQEFLEMVEKEKRGDMTLDEIEQELGRRYRMKGDAVFSKPAVP
ncbi:MAG: antitoxin VbhA family protein [Coriobacteriales bacterium]|nr:antitoxin VbhA family protein [Coriobacteriales bacterium]